MFRNALSVAVRHSLKAHSLPYKAHHVADLETQNILQINRYERRTPHITEARGDLS